MWSSVIRNSTVIKYLRTVRFLQSLHSQFNDWNGRQVEGLPEQLVQGAKRAAELLTSTAAQLPGLFLAAFGLDAPSDPLERYEYAREELRELVAPAAAADSDISARDVAHAVLLEELYTEQDKVSDARESC